MAGTGLAALVNQRLRKFPNLDPRAVLAVASQEGLGGGIGDGGHAFGPFQLNNAGGVITGKFPGQTPEQINQWAWSPAGIDYALSGINNVAGGLKGAPAVTNIVSRFERPANIPRETQGALRAYGGVPVVSGADTASMPPQGLTGPPGGTSRPSPDPVFSQTAQAAQSVSTLGQQFALHLVNSAQQMLGGGTPNLSQLFAAAKGFQQAREQLARAQAPPKQAPLGPGTHLAMSAAGK